MESLALASSLLIHTCTVHKLITCQKDSGSLEDMPISIRSAGSVVAFVILGSSLAGGAQPEHVGGDIGKGKVLYQQHCVTCHGPRGQGDGPFGSDLAPPAANLSAPATQAKPDVELLSAIKEGKPGTAMQSFKHQLSDQQAHDVLAFVRSLVRSK